MILEAADLASLRSDVAAVAAEVFPDTGQVRRKGSLTVTNNHPEILTNQFEDLGDPVPCSYEATNPRDVTIANKNTGVTALTIKVPAGIDIQEGDQFVIAAKGTTAPEIVTDVVNPRLKSNAMFWYVLTIKR